jgi:predicted DsbA family dithiol-disulfide isomerase
MARLAHAIAMENRNVSADVVEIQEFPSLAQRYVVRSVPLIIINEQIRVTGAVREPELVEKVLQVGISGGPDPGAGRQQPLH